VTYIDPAAMAVMANHDDAAMTRHAGRPHGRILAAPRQRESAAGSFHGRVEPAASKADHLGMSLSCSGVMAAPNSCSQHLAGIHDAVGSSIALEGNASARSRSCP